MIAMADKEQIRLSDLRAGKETKGLVCPKCSSRHCPVDTVVQQFDEAKRYRKCRNCGHRFRTFERIG